MLDRIIIGAGIALAIIAFSVSVILAWNKENQQRQVEREILNTLREISDKL
jgi:hypothetical protein